MKKEMVFNLLKEMFKDCGDVLIYSMNNSSDEVIFKWRIRRNWEVGSRMNWSKCKRILNKKGIKFIEGESGWGWRESRGIDFDFNG